MRADFLNEITWFEWHTICKIMLYLVFKTIILLPLEGNDKRHKMNSNNNRLKHPIYQLHFKNVWAVVLISWKVWWISQSVCITWVLYVQLCNYSNNFNLMHFFKTFHDMLGKNILGKLPYRHMFSIKLFICSFPFKISFRASMCFQ